MLRWEQQVGLLLLAAILLGAALVVTIMRRRKTPLEKELRRRIAVNRSGRLADGLITEVMENTIFFSYTVRGVTYASSQDVSQLRAQLPEDPARLIGPATVKYLMANPANSILICEEWSGLRAAAGVAQWKVL